MWWLVVGSGYDCWVKTVRQRGKEGERETMRLEREDEKNRNKKGIKNYKEIIFK